MEDNDILWQSILKTEFDINKIESLSKEHGHLVLFVHDKRGFSILHWAVILGKLKRKKINFYNYFCFVLVSILCDQFFKIYFNRS